MLQCHVLDSAGAGDAHPGPMSHTWDDAMSCSGHLLPILGFSVFQPKLALLQLQPLSRGFFFWESKAGMNHPLLMTGAHILYVFPTVFPGLRSWPVAAEGTILNPESSDRKLSKNPAFLAVSPQVCRWMELNWIRAPCTPWHRTSSVGEYMLSESQRGFWGSNIPQHPCLPTRPLV